MRLFTNRTSVLATVLNARVRYIGLYVLFSPPGCCSTCGGLYVFLLFIFNDFCQTNYLNIYRTDLRQIYRVVRSMAVDDQSESSFFRSLKGLCLGNRSLLALSTELSSGDIRQMAVYEK